MINPANMHSSQAGKYEPAISVMGEQPASPASNAVFATCFVLATLPKINTRWTAWQPF
jgi:hypothetical protein